MPPPLALAPLRAVFPRASLRAFSTSAAVRHAGCSDPTHSHSHSHSHSPSQPQSQHQSHSHSHSHAQPPPSQPTPSAAEDASPKRRTPGAALNLPVSSGGPQEAAAYCSSLVQRLDPDAWLCSYFWPQKEREWWFAIRAFNLELHQVVATVSQPAIAAMRFQFWRDALVAIYSKDKPIPQHPVALALHAARQARPIQRYYLSQLIDVRAKSLSEPPAAATLEGLLTSRAPLSNALLQGALPIVVAPTNPETSHLAHTLSHVAHLLTVSQTLRALPTLIAKRQLNIPADIAAQHGVVDEEVFRKGAEATGFRDAIFTIATRGMDELITARRDLNSTGGKVVPPAAMPIFLAAVPAESYLKRLEEADFDIFNPSMAKHDWKLAPRIWWRYQSGKL